MCVQPTEKQPPVTHIVEIVYSGIPSLFVEYGLMILQPNRQQPVSYTTKRTCMEVRRFCFGCKFLDKTTTAAKRHAE